MRWLKSIALLLLCTALVEPASAGLGDLLRGIMGGGESGQKSTGTDSGGGAGLSSAEVARGLKEALAKGTRRAIDELGKPGGFLDNAQVRIPMPKHMRTVEKTLRRLGQDKYADEFVAAMNHAAEQAVVTAAPVFKDAVKQLTVDDAMKILRGPQDAATRYFRQKTSGRLSEKMLPIVRQATNRAGVTAAYKRLVERLGFARGMLSDDMGDIDKYVTDKTLDGLFLMVANEEKRIRENPVARTTELLKKVFGSTLQH